MCIRDRASSVQGLVRIDVAHTGDRRLVEKDCLQRRPATAKALVQVVGPKVRVDRLWAEHRHRLEVQKGRLGAQQEAPESPRVAISELSPVVQIKHRMGVGGQRRRRIHEAELPAHAQVHDKHDVVNQPDEDVLSSPPDSRDLETCDRVDEDLWFRVPHDGRKAQVAANDGPAYQVWPQVGDDGFDLRQLRHPSSYARTTASFFMSAQLGPTFVSTSMPVSSSYAPVLLRGTFSANWSTSASGTSKSSSSCT